MKKLILFLGLALTMTALLTYCTNNLDENSKELPSLNNGSEDKLGLTCIDPTKIDSTIVCPTIYDPVCGCNGKTYGNACEAEKAGVVSYKPGKCPTTTPCKGKPNPQIFCLDVYDPVCGCDGNTYSNACYAKRAGVLRYTKGACGANE